MKPIRLPKQVTSLELYKLVDTIFRETSEKYSCEEFEYYFGTPEKPEQYRNYPFILAPSKNDEEVIIENCFDKNEHFFD